MVPDSSRLNIFYRYISTDTQDIAQLGDFVSIGDFGVEHNSAYDGEYDASVIYQCGPVALYITRADDVGGIQDNTLDVVKYGEGDFILNHMHSHTDNVGTL